MKDYSRMRSMLMPTLMILTGLALLPTAAWAKKTPAPAPASDQAPAPKTIDISADQTLEYYQDQRIYVARGNAKAIRGDTTIEADTLLAHQRDKSTTPQPAPKSGSGDIDKMTAEGNVRITSPKQRVYGDHATYDMDQHVAVMTGNNLRYETDKDTVTARDTLEYYDDKKIAVARGNAVAIQNDRRVNADVLTAEFRDMPNGQQQLWKMTAQGTVTIVTGENVTKGDKAVYDLARNIAIVTGHVRVTKKDGTQLSGDVAEVDFTTNQSRLLNDGHGRVRALLSSKPDAKNGAKGEAQ